jgi:hypothetical protein
MVKGLRLAGLLAEKPRLIAPQQDNGTESQGMLMCRAERKNIRQKYKDTQSNVRLIRQNLSRTTMEQE